MRKVYSPGDLAKIFNIARPSVHYWIKKKYVKTYKTPGGHNRIKLDDLIDFMQENDIPISRLGTLGTKTILVIEDNPEQLDIFVKALKTVDYFDVHGSSEGVSAGMLIKELLPDVIVLDIRLPGTDGVKICELIRQDKELSETNILGISGKIRSSEDEMIKKGFDGFLRKPFDMEIFIQKVQSILPAERHPRETVIKKTNKHKKHHPVSLRHCFL
jgi:CheY-like chemotaxis protein